jgi:hypothetical protein
VSGHTKTTGRENGNRFGNRALRIHQVAREQRFGTRMVVVGKHKRIVAKVFRCERLAQINDVWMLRRTKEKIRQVKQQQQQKTKKLQKKKLTHIHAFPPLNCSHSLVLGQPESCDACMR